MCGRSSLCINLPEREGVMLQGRLVSIPSTVPTSVNGTKQYTSNVALQRNYYNFTLPNVPEVNKCTVYTN